jgi:carbon storage regulator
VTYIHDVARRHAEVRPGRGSESPEERATMLVLTRKLLEKVYIGEQICVTVVRLEGGQVRLGIDAPREIPVLRAELKQRDAAAETAAGAPPPVPAPESTLRIRPDAARGSGIRRRGPSR